MKCGGTLMTMPPDVPRIIGPLARQRLLGTDVTHIARELLGMALSTTLEGITTVGIITETEAYAGIQDRASHAHGGRRTARTAPMYARGGTAYVYLCYGIHHLFNVVTGPEDVPHAVLVRAIIPWQGLTPMEQRTRPHQLRTTGPGTLTRALGIRTAHTGSDLIDGPIKILRTTLTLAEDAIRCGPRVGVEYAGPDALLPYRFRVAPSQLQAWKALLLHT